MINSDFGVQPKKINKGESLIFAHKGIAKYYPENSAKSFDACKSVGLMAIEADVRQTADGNLIIFHDSNTKRMLGHDAIVHEVDFHFFNDKYLISENPSDSLKVLTIDKFLQRYKDDYFIYLDIKTANNDVADRLIQKFEAYDLYDKCIVADADFLFLSYLKYKDARIITALEGFGAGKGFLYHFIPERLMPDYFASFLSQVDVDYIDFLKGKGLMDRYIAYDVNLTNILKAESLGVKHIIMDYDTILGENHSIPEYSNMLKNQDRR